LRQRKRLLSEKEKAHKQWGGKEGKGEEPRREGLKPWVLPLHLGGGKRGDAPNSQREGERGNFPTSFSEGKQPKGGKASSCLQGAAKERGVVLREKGGESPKRGKVSKRPGKEGAGPGKKKTNYLHSNRKNLVRSCGVTTGRGGDQLPKERRPLALEGENYGKKKKKAYEFSLKNEK